MTSYSSSLIKLVNDHCHKALDFYEKETPYDASQMAYGIASHAVIEAIGKSGIEYEPEQQGIADAVAKELITHGRTFRGRHEPPMSPDNAFLGRDVALNYLKYNDLPDGAQYEIELSVKLGPNDRPFVALHDCVWLEEESDEYGERKTAVTRDWKGWQGREEELETIQRKAQAVTLLQEYSGHPGLTHLRLEVCNLQTHRVFKKEITLDDEGLELINRWSNDLEIVCSAADRTREATPGVGCLSCPYNHACVDRLDHYAASNLEDIESYAMALVFLETERANAIKALKACQELPVRIQGGYVGWAPKSDNKVSDKALDAIFDAWFAKDGEFQTKSEIRGLLTAMGLGITNVKNVAKTLYGKESDAMFEDFIDSCIDEHYGRQFGVWKGEK